MSATDKQADNELSIELPAPSIPHNWAQPAQVSAAAAGVTTPPKSREVADAPGHPFLWLSLLALTACVAYLVTVGILTPDAPVEEDLFEGAAAGPPLGLNVPPAQAPRGVEAGGAVPAADPSFPTLPGANASAPKTSDKGKVAASTPPAAPGTKASSQAPVATPTAADAPPEMSVLPVKKKARSLVRRAERRLKLKNYAGARKLVEQALTLDPALPRAHRARAVICAHRGDANCAREAYRTYLKLAPNAPDAPDVRAILELGK